MHLRAFSPAKIFLACALAACWSVAARAAEVVVRTPAGLREAVADAKPGTTILLVGGNYGGGFHFSNVRGAEGNPIVIAAADLKDPPVFTAAKTGLHLSNAAYVELRGLSFTALTANGLNIDDTGARDENGTHHIVLRGLRVADVGGGGNEDCIKLSGVRDFRIIDCTVERWGTGGGSGIDMVGCHRGEITGSLLRHTSPPNCTGVQAKGGSSDIVVVKNRFEYAGGRAVNIGGSTGLQFFRPKLSPGAEYAEARNIRIEGNTFVGAVTPIAFTGVDGAIVRFNTIEKPGRWALRILQENRSAGFVPCRNGMFSDNLIVFESSRWSDGGVNVGAGTAPETFTFARNWWYCEDRPARSQAKLPVPEKEGVHGRPPTEAEGKAGASAWRG